MLTMQYYVSFRFYRQFYRQRFFNNSLLTPPSVRVLKNVNVTRADNRLRSFPERYENTNAPLVLVLKITIGRTNTRR